MDLNAVKVYIFGKFNYLRTKCTACQWELTFFRADKREKRPLAQPYQPSVISLVLYIPIHTILMFRMPLFEYGTRYRNIDIRKSEQNGFHDKFLISKPGFG